MATSWMHPVSAQTIDQLQALYVDWLLMGHDGKGIVFLILQAGDGHRIPPRAIFTLDEFTRLIGGGAIARRVAQAPPPGTAWLAVNDSVNSQMALAALPLPPTDPQMEKESENRSMEPPIDEEGLQRISATYRDWLLQGGEPDVVILITDTAHGDQIERKTAFVPRGEFVATDQILKVGSVRRSIARASRRGGLWIVYRSEGAANVAVWQWPVGSGPT